MDWKKACNTIMELLGNINKWYLNEYEEELDTLWGNVVENEEMKEDKETIYNMIAEIYDYIEENDYIEKEYILEKLATMQQYAK